MAFNYYDIEDDYISQLQAGFAASSLDADVVKLPETESEIIKAIEKPRITVAFVAAVAQKTQSTNEQSYQEDITTVINIQWKALRGTNGCHTIAGLIKKYLVGYKPRNCGRSYFKNYQGSNPVRNPDDKLWYWDMEFGVSKVSMQQIEDEITGTEPLLQTLTFNDQVGQCNS